MSDSLPTVDQNFLEPQGWLRLLQYGEPDARAWVEEFYSCGGDSAAGQISRAVKLMHQRRLTEAEAILGSARCDAVATLRDAPASIRYTVDCWHASAKALYHHIRSEFELAEQEIDRTCEVVLGAIEEQSFLQVLGIRFVDVEMQRAQVAGKQYDWEDMEQHIKIAWNRLQGSAPLCVLKDRTQLHFSNIEAFLMSIPLTEGQAQASFGKLLDPVWRMRRFQALVAESYALSWVLIPYG